MNAPQKIDPSKTRIISLWNGKFYRSAETKHHIFFVNYNEGDMNGNTLMFDQSGKLVSDNYFAGSYLWELMQEGKSVFTKLSRRMKSEIELQINH